MQKVSGRLKRMKKFAFFFERLFGCPKAKMLEVWLSTNLVA